MTFALWRVELQNAPESDTTKDDNSSEREPNYHLKNLLLKNQSKWIKTLRPIRIATKTPSWDRRKIITCVFDIYS
jgi:hypothetical protein